MPVRVSVSTNGDTAVDTVISIVIVAVVTLLASRGVHDAVAASGPRAIEVASGRLTPVVTLFLAHVTLVRAAVSANGDTAVQTVSVVVMTAVFALLASSGVHRVVAACGPRAIQIAGR
jgi:hypothetical protein